VVGEPAPLDRPTDVPLGEALVWFRRGGEAPVRVHVVPPRMLHRRHRRKYAHGEIDPQHSFYFRGKNGRSPQRAANLAQFLAAADRIDDDTWVYHLIRGDFARWFSDVVKDNELALEARRGEALANAAVSESRALIRRAIEQRYTLPA
jgi:hypothetical protein